MSSMEILLLRTNFKVLPAWLEEKEPLCLNVIQSLQGKWSRKWILLRNLNDWEDEYIRLLG